MSSPGPHRYGGGRTRSAKSTRSDTLFITCSALGKEVRTIIRKHQWDAEYVPVDSRYHLYPVKIEEAVKEKLLETDGLYKRRVVVYGHCGAQKLDSIIAEHEGAIRPVGPHCYEMYGGADFRKSVKDVPGTYILTDYLIQAWDKLIVRGLKLDQHPQLKPLMFGHYKRMIHYSQEPNEKLAEKAQAIADDLGLELIVKHVAYGELETRLVAIMENRPQPGADAEQADYSYPIAGGTVSAKRSA
jgi:hypothetical protein